MSTLFSLYERDLWVWFGFWRDDSGKHWFIYQNGLHRIR